MFIKFFFIIFIFINCSNTVSSDITSNIDVDNGEIGTSSLESTSTTIFLSSPSSTILKLLPITTTTTTTVPQTTTSIGVTVANNGFSSNVYFLNGNQDATINVTEGNKYRFDLSDSSNSGHPLRFSTTQNGSEYSSNVIANGIAGTPGAYVEIEITSSTPNRLYLYCINHFGMGGNTVILTP